MCSGTNRKLRAPVVKGFQEHCINLKVTITVCRPSTIDTGARNVNCSRVFDIGRSVYHFCNIYTFQRDTQCSCTD